MRRENREMWRKMLDGKLVLSEVREGGGAERVGAAASERGQGERCN